MHTVTKHTRRKRLYQIECRPDGESVVMAASSEVALLRKSFVCRLIERALLLGQVIVLSKVCK